VLRFASFALLLAVCAAGAQQPAAPVQVPPAADDGLPAAEAAIAAADWKTAETRLDTWLAAHPADARALFDAGYVADAQNRLDDAIALYRRAAAADPQSFEAHLSLGLLLARQKKFDEAHTELATATALDAPGIDPALKARAWRALARIDRATDPTAASNDLIQALKISQETTDDILLAAELAAQTGQPAEAEAAYRRVLAADPKSSAARAGLAHLLIQQKKYAGAEQMLREALEKSPDDPALTAQLATVLAAQDNAEALPLLEKLHQDHPADNAITRMLATVRADAGDYAGADELDIKLLALAPQDADLLIAHGQNLTRQTQFEPAYSVFQQATRLAPANAEGWSGLAFAASRTNHPEVALQALTERAKSLPENATTLFLWATAYDSLHQKEQAAAYYHKFLEASAGKYANQEWQARQRLQILGTK